MEIIKSEKVLVYAFKTKATLNSMEQIVGESPKFIAQEIIKQNISIVGPQIWTYEGCNGNPDKEFVLNITFPVNKKGKDVNEFVFKELPAYKYVKKIHTGPYSDFPKIYESFMSQIIEAKLIPDNTNREIYLNCDFENQNNCIIEIQIGIV